MVTRPVIKQNISALLYIIGSFWSWMMTFEWKMEILLQNFTWNLKTVLHQVTYSSYEWFWTSLISKLSKQIVTKREDFEPCLGLKIKLFTYLERILDYIPYFKSLWLPSSFSVRLWPHYWRQKFFIHKWPTPIDDSKYF